MSATIAAISFRTCRSPRPCLAAELLCRGQVKSVLTQKKRGFQTMELFRRRWNSCSGLSGNTYAHMSLSTTEACGKMSAVWQQGLFLMGHCALSDPSISNAQLTSAPKLLPRIVRHRPGRPLSAALRSCVRQDRYHDQTTDQPIAASS